MAEKVGRMSYGNIDDEWWARLGERSLEKLKGGNLKKLKLCRVNVQ